MPLSDYATNALYDERLDLRSNSFVIGKDTELWLKELPYGQSVPSIVTITLDGVTNAVAIDDEVITLNPDVDVTLYRGDILKFTSTTFVVKTTTALTAATDGTVPILPAVGAVTASETARTYGMVPLISVQDGGGLEFSSNDAEARNKVQGVWSARKTISRTATTNITGAFIVTDAGAEILSDLTLGTRNVFAQSRYAPYLEFALPSGTTYIEGAGPGAWEFEATVNLSTPFNADEFVQVNATLNVSGRPIAYAALAPA